MIKGLFSFGGDVIEVIVDSNNVMFSDVSTGVITTIEGLKLDKSGVLKEFPDLKKNQDWRKIAIERLKEHLKKFLKENQKLEYIKDELKKYGYEPLTKQQAGFRQKKWI